MRRRNNMAKKLVLCLLTLCLAFDFITPGPLHENVSMSMTPRAHKKPGPVKSIFKRNVIGCRNDTQYPFQDLCCDSCKPGSFAKREGCTKDNPTTSCEKCIDGEEYMDNYNYHPKCRRCGHCDTQHGLEVEKNCTIHQNVKCRCRSGYFCNSSEPCRHCDPCDECKGGKILENCTQTNNTRCDRTEIVQDKTASIVAPVVVSIVVVVAIVIGAMWYVLFCGAAVRKKKKTKEYNVKEEPNGMLPLEEMKPLHYPDIDLLPHIPVIAEEMRQSDVKAFVRRLNVKPSRIDVIINDNPNDGAEQKIKLLECWYQEHGMKDAYKTLITTLRDLRFRATADKIEEKINGARK
uniref:tumor necrosis factor receptor superfamily member 6 isoform X1 n=1 Tax=Podarcis muralis TaxID=64176 RepID=UPI0010A09C72|nr:tumor necrosis factor receptor superfamily member 6 isoform X1 [Podarcis muralis]